MATEQVIALRKAIYNRDLVEVQRVITENLDIAAAVKAEGEWALKDAATRSTPEIVDVVFQKLKEPINQQDANEFTALVHAIGYNCTENVCKLLELGADVSVGHPLVEVAASGRLSDRIGVAKMLLEADADVNQILEVEDMPPQNALTMAMDEGHDELAEFLKTQGAVLPEGYEP